MRALTLEAFQPDPDPDPSSRTKQTLARALKSAQEEGYRQGFSDGAAASASEHAASEAVLREQFVEALRDAALAHAAVRSDIMAAFFTVAERVFRQFAVTVAQSLAPQEVVAHLRRAAEQAPDATLIVAAAPELAERLRGFLEDEAIAAEIVADPRLTPLEAQIRWENGFDRIDFDSALEAIERLLENTRQSIGAQDHADRRLGHG